jgi:hypothetical protein
VTSEVVSAEEHVASPDPARWMWTVAATLSVGFNLGITLIANAGVLRAYFLAVRQYAGDKVLHFVLVGSMAYFLARAVAAWLPRRPVAAAAAVLLALVVLAVTEETCQQWLSARSFDLRDMAANVAGITAFGAVSLWQISRRGGEEP